MITKTIPEQKIIENDRLATLNVHLSEVLTSTDQGKVKQLTQAKLTVSKTLTSNS